METMVRGWKCFDRDLRCRNFQFEVGKAYEAEGKLVMCGNGFHFHEHGAHLFNYYGNKVETRVCEVVAHEVLSDGDKSVCRKIEIVRELSYQEVCLVFGLPAPNTGYGDGSG